MPRTPRASLWERFAGSRPAQVLGVGVGVLALVAFGREALHRYEISQQIRDLETQVRELEARKSQLGDLLGYFGSPLFQEQEARQKLGRAKPGETVVIVPTVSTEPVTESSTTEPFKTKSREVPNPVRWWQYFFGTASSQP